MEQEKIPADEAASAARWSERFGWIGSLLMALFAGLAPAPPPKPLRPTSEYHQKAENPDISKLDSDFILTQSDESSVDRRIAL
jgi:hypothetical protein